MSLSPSDADAIVVQSPVTVLASILNEIGASPCLQVFVDHGHDDSTLRNVSNLKPERISSIFGLSLEQAVAFICKAKV